MAIDRTCIAEMHGVFSQLSGLDAFSSAVNLQDS